MKIATMQAWKMKGPLPDVETNVSGITDPFLLNNRVFFRFIREFLHYHNIELLKLS